MAVVANWSQLPKDILILISERIDNELDLIRFRSVCSSWRSSSIPNHHHISLPLKYSLSDPFCSLSKCNIFLIKPPQQQDETLIYPWLIRVTENSSGKTKLYESLFLTKFPFTFPFSIDLYNSSVLNLGSDFIIDEKSLKLQLTHLNIEEFS
ncbi:F-box protein [Trifolium medium]|uniref:F-box protein n=1 Tax=Trifolium medium TaxID=97028 RepID=A0A392QCS3_9FABA|nr:F-box protein [Trifolium medium]